MLARSDVKLIYLFFQSQNLFYTPVHKLTFLSIYMSLFSATKKEETNLIPYYLNMEENKQ
jgi:hypothetical protein